MRLFIIITIIIFWQSSLWAEIPKTFAHRIYQEDGQNNTLHFSHVLLYEEVEFEDINTEEYLDLFDSREFDVLLEYKRVFKNNYQFGVGITYTFDGQLKKRYQDFQGLPSLYIEPNGLKKINLMGAKTFVNDKFIHTIKFEAVGGPTAREDKVYHGGIDVNFSYHFLYYTGYLSPFAELYNIVSFPKKMKRLDGEVERQRSYSEVFTRVGVIYEREKFYALGSLGFGLMTDYEIESPSYHRVADKGFRTYWKLGLGYQFTKAWSLQAHYIRSSQVFNSQNHDPEFTDVDYEIETDELKLELIWAF